MAMPLSPAATTQAFRPLNASDFFNSLLNQRWRSMRRRVCTGLDFGRRSLLRVRSPRQHAANSDPSIWLPWLSRIDTSDAPLLMRAHACPKAGPKSR